MLFSVNGDDKTIAAATGIHFFVLKEYKQAANVYGYKGVESALMLLHQYNLKSIGINSTSTSDASLLKELLCKMMM
jgi:DNA polymerase-3 subunit delta